jgi:lipopolysaccharide export system permease protein
MFPYMFSALLIAILTYGLGAYVIPKGNVVRLEFENTYKKKKKVETARNIQMEVEPNVIAYIERFERSNSTAYRFSLDRFEDNAMKSHFTARTLVYQGDKDNPYLWKAKNWQHRVFTDTLEHITNGLQVDTIIQIEPYDLLISKNQQETLTSPQLKTYIEKQRRRGIANIKEFEIEYHKRIATSFAAFILTLIGLALSVKKVKGGMGLNLGIGIALSFGYIVFQTISSTFAVNGSTPPIVAVWIPNIAFLIIGIYLYGKASK